MKVSVRFCSSDPAPVSGLFEAERVGGPGGIQATGVLAITSLRRTAGLLKANYTSIIDVIQLLTAYLPPQLGSALPTCCSWVVWVVLCGVCECEGAGSDAGLIPDTPCRGHGGQQSPLWTPSGITAAPGIICSPVSVEVFTLLKLSRGFKRCGQGGYSCKKMFLSPPV